MGYRKAEAAEKQLRRYLKADSFQWKHDGLSGLNVHLVHDQGPRAMCGVYSGVGWTVTDIKYRKCKRCAKIYDGRFGKAA